MRFYAYDNHAGHYGNGGWVVYTYDCFGMKEVSKVFCTEQECIEYGARRES